MTYERKTNRIARKWHTVVTIAPFVDYTPDQCIAIRMKAGLTQGEMSRVLGVSPATILNIETGKTAPPRYVARFYEILEMEPNFLKDYGLVSIEDKDDGIEP